MSSTRYWISLAMLATIMGCGAVEGDVYGAGTQAGQRLSDVDVLLVPQSDSLLGSVDSLCQDEKTDEARREVERKRLDLEAQRLRDSAAAVYGVEYQSPRWRAIMDAAKAVADSSARISIAGADPVTIAERHAVRRARTDGQGHYRIDDVRAGRYFVVPLTRESEFAAVQWYPSHVRFGTARVDATEKDGWAGCYLTSMGTLGSNDQR